MKLKKKNNKSIFSWHLGEEEWDSSSSTLSFPSIYIPRNIVLWGILIPLCQQIELEENLNILKAKQTADRYIFISRKKKSRGFMKKRNHFESIKI